VIQFLKKWRVGSMANCVVVEVRASLEHPSSGDLAVKETKNDQGKFKNSLQLPHIWMSKLSKP
jgi:hypothetical protein